MNSSGPQPFGMNLVWRILTSVGMIALVFFGLYEWPRWVFALGVGAFAGWGSRELFALMTARGIRTEKWVGMIASALLPLWVYWDHRGGLGGTSEVAFLVAVCFVLFILQFLHPQKAPCLESVAMTFFGVLYCGWFLSHLVKIHLLAEGRYWLFYILTVTKVSDVAAYFAGSLWGKTKILPHLSPNKSLQGTLAGFAASGLVSMGFAVSWPSSHSGRPLLFALGCAVGFLAQCGDLSESLIKRYCSVKDSGKTVPGFGGVLDLMDSILFTVPFFYYLLTLSGIASVN